MSNAGDPASLELDFFTREVVQVARDLVGVRLLVDGVGGIIVETEAYERTDPASHAFRGPTAGNAVMFGPPGHAYVYRSYGLHWCLNFVCGVAPGAAVLIRALEPTDGFETMEGRRGLIARRLLCAGPGRLCQALAVNRDHNGLSLSRPPFLLLHRPVVTDGALPSIAVGRRIGLTKGVDTPWRFGAAGSPYLSRPMP